MRRTFIAALLLLLATPAGAAEPAPCTPCEAPKKPPARSTFEFSLASSHPFPIEHIGKYDDDVDIVPVSTVLLLLEYIITPSWRTRFFYDLALTTDKRIIAGEVEERVIPSSLGFGLTWVPWRFSFLKSSQVEFQGTIYAGMILEEPVEFFPWASGRIHLMQDSNTGVGIYLGAMFAFVRNTAGPFYGVSYRF